MSLCYTWDSYPQGRVQILPTRPQVMRLVSDSAEKPGFSQPPTEETPAETEHPDEELHRLADDGCPHV
jgi:hypothetical protein